MAGEFDNNTEIGRKQANQRYADHVAAAQLRMAEITAALNDNFGYDPARVSWSDVGSAEYIAQQLAEIAIHMPRRAKR